MADRPIIFSAPMIRALLAGRKTQTRRILKTRLDICASEHLEDLELRGFEAVEQPDGQFLTYRVPYAVGDRLYVRENHALVPSSAYRMSEGVEQTINPGDRGLAAIYAAGWDRSKPRWRPSIHMPRWASRLTLLVTDVRVERLHDISEADAEAEGCEFDLWDQTLAVRDYSKPDGWFQAWSEDAGGTYVEADRIWRASFRSLWESINGPEAWAANPWVVVIGFTVHARNIDQLAPIAEVAA